MDPSSEELRHRAQQGSVVSSVPSNVSDSSSNDRDGEIQEKLVEQTPAVKIRPKTSEGPLNEDDPQVYTHLGFSYPTWYKWYILSVIFVIQSSMNFNASIYANGTGGIEKEFGIDAQAARVGQLIFLVAYAFGCELWAPWSEEYGRRPILQLSLGLVNLWAIPCALAPNFATIVFFRLLGGLSSAGGSVTLGMVADMWQPDDQHYAVAYVVFSSVGGSVIGPIVGGFVETYLNWRWVFWLQLIFGGATQLIHFFTVKETRSSVLMSRYAAKLRKDGLTHIYTTEDRKKLKVKESKVWNIDGMPLKEIVVIWIRPFKMLLTEPIVLFLSLLSGFSDALIFTFLESYSPVFKQWGFSSIAIGLAFIPLLVGYTLAWVSFFPWFEKQRKLIQNGGDYPEYRLKWLLFLAPLETIGLFGFAWTSMGPEHNHWIVPLVFSAFVGVANYAIYMATIDYMVASYGPYSASATGGNGFCRDFLAGIAAVYAMPLYTNLGPFPKNLAYASTLLACLALCVTIPIYVFYIKGPQIRARSKFAEQINAAMRRHQRNRGALPPSRPVNA